MAVAMEAESDRIKPHHHVTFATPGPVELRVSTSPSPSVQRKATPKWNRNSRLGVDELGQYIYKKTPSSTLMASLQLGLQHSIGSLEPKSHRDILVTDFAVTETVEFPAEGSGCTPAHKYKDFTFKTYSPEAMRFFREAFGIKPEDFMLALCDRPLREVSNPGASGSLFYLSADDAFILKTVQKKEARFLQKLLPGYYLNLTQHKRTLLPKYFGLYRYKSGSVNIRIVVMNNLLPSGIKYHEKYDLKGSTYKRRANSAEIQKKSPTWKDLDFAEKHEEGIFLSPEKYDALLHSLERDCRVLESFGIMDYSLLLGVHNLDQEIKEKAEAVDGADSSCDDYLARPVPSMIELSKNFSIVSTEDIPTLLAKEQEQRPHYPEGYIIGHIHGDRVMLYLGIIDILQSYRLKKKLEHGLKSVITDGATVSVHNPSFYARRFQDFMTTQVFKRDRTKSRTRMNSPNFQLRGRRPAGQAPGGVATAWGSPAGDRWRSSPAVPGSAGRIRGANLLSPPSYNQATSSTSAPVSIKIHPPTSDNDSSASQLNVAATSVSATTVELEAASISDQTSGESVNEPSIPANLNADHEPKGSTDIDEEGSISAQDIVKSKESTATTEAESISTPANLNAKELKGSTEEAESISAQVIVNAEESTASDEAESISTQAIVKSEEFMESPAVKSDSEQDSLT